MAVRQTAPACVEQAPQSRRICCQQCHQCVDGLHAILFQWWGEPNVDRASGDLPKVNLKLGSKGGHQSDEGSTEQRREQLGQGPRVGEAKGG